MTLVHYVIAFAFGVGIALVPGGCGPVAGSRTTESPLESQENLVYVDRTLLLNIPCEHLQAERLSSGRLRVRARFYNKQDQTAECQVKLKFRDSGGNPVDETSWMPILLPRREVTAFEHTCLSPNATDFVLLLRAAQ